MYRRNPKKTYCTAALVFLYRGKINTRSAYPTSALISAPSERDDRTPTITPDAYAYLGLYSQDRNLEAESRLTRPEDQSQQSPQPHPFDGVDASKKCLSG